MRFKTLSILGITTAIAAVFVAQGAFATHLGVPHSPDAQTFEIDIDQCLGTGNTLTGGESSKWLPNSNLACAGAENLTAGAAVVSSTSVLLLAGNRLGLPTSYTAPGFVLSNDAAIADGTQVGAIKALTDIGCDGTADIFADSTTGAPTTFGGAIGEQVLEASVIYDPSEAFITASTPPFAKIVRYRAGIDTLYVNAGATQLGLANKVSLNVVVQELPWQAGAYVSNTLLGGDASAPSTQLLCLDSPQTSDVDYNAAAGYTNPVAAGLYARWTSEVSADGVVDNTKQTFSYVTACKEIGGAVADADDDCLSDASDANDANHDQDKDGLLDGIETGWGSNPTLADTDADGRTDLEEMMGPTILLTNPLVADTDGDGLVDAGLIVDCDGDGQPDSGVNYEGDTAAAGSGGTGAEDGRNRISVEINATCGNIAGKGGRASGNPPATTFDNCPNISNAAQTNTGDDDANNDRIGGAADVTQPNASETGDACSGDRDNDGVPDLVELGLVGAPGYFFSAAGNPGADNKCNTTGGTAISLADTDGDGFSTVNDPDSDSDGTLDGAECQLGSNPDDVASKNLSAPTGTQSTFFRAQGLVLGPATSDADFDQDGAVPNTDGDSDGNCNLTGANDGNGQATCGALVLPQSIVGDGLNYRGDLAREGAGGPGTADEDRDGCADLAEVLDVNADRVVSSGDKLQIDRAAAAKGAWLPPALPVNQIEVSVFDTNGDGSLTSGDQLVMNRGLASKFGPFNLNCTAASIGTAAN